MTQPAGLDVLWLALLGGWAAIDSNSFGQLMVSRPLVAASLAGWLMGDAAAGATIGLLLEAFHLNVLPVGAARYPEAGPAAVVAGAAHAAAGGAPGALLMVVLFTLGWEWVGGQSVHQLRHANIRLTAGTLDAASLQGRHLLATALDFARGAALAVAGWLFLSLALARLLPHWGLDPGVTRLVTIGLLVALLAGSLQVLGGRRRLFALGLAGAAVIVLVTG